MWLDHFSMLILDKFNSYVKVNMWKITCILKAIEKFKHDEISIGIPRGGGGKSVTSIDLIIRDPIGFNRVISLNI